MDILSVISLVLCVAGLLLSLWRKAPAALLSYAGLVTAWFAGAGRGLELSSESLIFWGVATLIVLGLQVLNASEAHYSRASVLYCVCGAIVGGVLGIAIKPTPAAIILGAVAGAFLGAVAFTRTPQGIILREGRKSFVDYLCAIGLPAVVTSSLSCVAAAAVLF